MHSSHRSQFIDALRTFGLARQKGIVFSEEDRDLEWKATDRVRSEAYRPLRGVLDGLFVRQMNALLDDNRKGLFDNFDVWAEIFRQALAGTVVDVMGRGYRIGLIRTGLEEDVALSAENAVVNEIIRSNQINETTKLQLLQALEGTDVGNLDQTERIVRDVFARIRSYRTDRIARTMGVAGFEAGQQTAYVDAGLTGKEWLTQRDGRVRGLDDGTGHYAADKQEVSVLAPFLVSCQGRAYKEPLMHPGDPGGSACNTINCRCTSLGVL